MGLYTALFNLALNPNVSAEAKKVVANVVGKLKQPPLQGPVSQKPVEPIKIYGAGISDAFQAGAAKSDFRPHQGPVQKPSEGPIQQFQGVDTFEENKKKLEADAYQKGLNIAKGKVKLNSSLDVPANRPNGKPQLGPGGVIVGAAIKNEVTKTAAQLKELGKASTVIDQKVNDFSNYLQQKGFGATGKVLQAATGIITKPTEAMGQAVQSAEQGRPVKALGEAGMGLIGQTPFGVIFNALSSHPDTGKVLNSAFDQLQKAKTSVSSTPVYNSIKDKFAKTTGINPVHFDDAFNIIADVGTFILAHKALSLGGEALTTKTLKITPEEAFKSAQEITTNNPSGVMPEKVDAIRELFKEGGDAVHQAIKTGLETKVPRKFFPELSQKIAQVFSDNYEALKSQRGTVRNPLGGAVPDQIAPVPQEPTGIPAPEVASAKPIVAAQETLDNLHNSPARIKGFDIAFDGEVKNYLNDLRAAARNPNLVQGGAATIEKFGQKIIDIVNTAQDFYSEGRFQESMMEAEKALQYIHERALGLQNTPAYLIEKFKNQNPIVSENPPTSEAPPDLKSLVDRSTLHYSVKPGESLDGRDLRQETIDMIHKQNQKIPDVEIAQQRADMLLPPESLDEIIARKRGIITDAEAIDRARTMKVTLDEALNIKKGTTLNKEQITAVSQLLQNKREENLKFKQLVEMGPTLTADERTTIQNQLGGDIAKLKDGELLNRAYAENTLKLKKLEIVRLALGSEAGRSLQGLKQQVEAVDSRMRAIYQRIKTKTPLEQQAVVEEIAKAPIENNKNFIRLLDKLNKADFFDKAAEYITAAKLWNPTTHIVNQASNTVRQVFDLAVQSAITPHLVPADIAGAFAGLGKGLRNAVRALSDEGYAEQLSKFIEGGGNAPAIKGTTGKMVRIPLRLLTAEDEIFRAISFERSLYRDAAVESKKLGIPAKDLITKPTEKMLERAKASADKLTFQESMGDFMRNVDKLRTPANYKSKPVKGLALLIRQFVPFLKTPMNLMKQAFVDFTPAGLKNIKPSERFSEANRRVFAEAAIGTGLLFWFWQKTKDGIITGAAPSNKAEADQFYREGKLPYSVKIGDKWYQYKRIDPFATVLGLAADLANNVDHLDTTTFPYYTTLIGKQLRDKTFLQGLDDFLKLTTGEEWEKEQVLKQLVTGVALPSFIGAAARAIDPTIRNPETLKDAFLSQIPYLSKQLPAKINAIGNTSDRASKGLNAFFNPFLSGDTSKVDPVTSLLSDTGTFLALPPQSFKVLGQEIKLNNRQYEKFSTLVGGKTYKALIKLVNNKKFKELPIEDQQGLVDSARKVIIEVMKLRFVMDNKLLEKGKILESMGTKGFVAEYKNLSDAEFNKLLEEKKKSGEFTDKEIESAQKIRSKIPKSTN